MDGSHSASGGRRWMNAAKPAGWFFSGMAVLGLCMLARWYMPAESADAKPPAPVKKASATERSKTPSNAAPSAPVAKRNPVAALVNNEPITREELGKECLLHYGAEVLESMVNRTLILSSCEERNIVITDEQIGEEIDRMARKFALPKDQWLKMLEKERGIKPDRYGKDIIWPTLALRELAKNQLKITPEEIEEAYDSEFGPAVKVRLIAIHSAEKAKQVRAQAVAKPEEFPALAKKYSQDTNSASAYGLIQPIRHRMGDANLEKAAFALKKGEVSQVVKVGEMHVFVKCEEHMPPAKGVDRAKVEPLLADALKDRKLRMAAGDVFKELQENAKVENVYNDPVKNKQMPGVAAVINGQKILIRELAEECIDRHGKDVLEGAINRRLLDQALRKRNLKISDDELDAEIGRAATAMGKTKPNGQPDIEAWLAHVAKTENITRDVYVRDEVWPSVALKKLVGDKVPITNQDLQRGYEANYGPKVRCRAIVLNNQHRAQEIWEKARHDMNVKAFGDLAEQYSIEAGSRSLRGEVPPIQRHGGQPLLETEAFALDAENPLSGIIQVGGNFIILFFEGRTTPVKTSFEEVKDLVYRDIHEKKLRLAMAKMFDNLKEDSHVDNFVTANIKLPKKEEKAELDIDPGIKTPKVHKR
jgi:parvulin-like peptidyl-prolyl isomerase